MHFWIDTMHTPSGCNDSCLQRNSGRQKMKFQDGNGSNNFESMYLFLCVFSTFHGPFIHNLKSHKRNQGVGTILDIYIRMNVILIYLMLLYFILNNSFLAGKCPQQECMVEF